MDRKTRLHHRRLKTSRQRKIFVGIIGGMLLIGVPAFATDGNPLGHLNNAKNAIDQAQAALDQAWPVEMADWATASSTSISVNMPDSFHRTVTKECSALELGGCNSENRAISFDLSQNPD